MSWDVWHAASHPPKSLLSGPPPPPSPPKAPVVHTSLALGGDGALAFKWSWRWKSIMNSTQARNEQMMFSATMNSATMLKHQVTSCTPHPDDFLQSRLNPGTWDSLSTHHKRGPCIIPKRAIPSQYQIMAFGLPQIQNYLVNSKISWRLHDVVLFPRMWTLD